MNSNQSNNQSFNYSRYINVNNLNENSKKYNLDETKYKIKLHPHQLTLLQSCIDFENGKLFLKIFNAVS